MNLIKFITITIIIIQVQTVKIPQLFGAFPSHHYGK